MRITKSQLMDEIEKSLKSNPSMRINVKTYPRLKNGRWGLKPYEVGYDVSTKSIMVYPFSGSIASWLFDANKLRVPELREIKSKIENYDVCN